MATDSSSRTAPEERLVNLVVALMATEQGLTKDTILSSVAGYREQSRSGASKDALEKMFERHKQTLRSLAIHVETIGDYADPDVHRLRFIANARDLGFPIEEIRTLLGLWGDGARSSADVKTLATARADELGRKAAALEAMRRALLDLAGRCHGDDRPDCPIIDDLVGRP